VNILHLKSGQFSSPVLRLSTRVQSTAVPGGGTSTFDLVAEHGSRSFLCMDPRVLERECVSSFATVTLVVLALS
jgi:hypothetical protein